MVEGDAENLLLPVLADILGYPLEKYGISIVNVGSTAFLRYSGIVIRKDGSTIGNSQRTPSSDSWIMPGRTGSVLQRLLSAGIINGFMKPLIEKDGESLPAKFVYVRNKSKRKDWLVIVSTDMELSEEEIIRVYGKRWDIEVFFKTCKS